MKKKIAYIVPFVCVLALVLILVLTAKNDDPSSEGSAPENAGAMTVVFPSLGKADCAILYEEGACVIIDCANKGDGKGIADKVKSLGAEQVDALFITHFDKDHIGGAAKLLTSVFVKRVYEPVYDDSEIDSSEYAAYRLALETAQANGTELIGLTKDTVITFGDLTLSVWCAAKTYEKSVDNNHSFVIKAESYGQTLLFAGDIEKQRIDDTLGKYDLKCDLLKVPHHGEYNKSTGKFITQCSPSFAVITCSDEEPAEKSTLQALANAGAAVYSTKDGEITFICSKDGIKVQTE